MGCLTGIRVLDLTRLLPGPYCTMLLGDLGAEVIKVEEKGRGDYAREMLPGIFYAVNRNKKSLSINLKSEEGRQIVLDLAEQCQIVVEGFRPGVVQRLGVDYESIKKINPGIIYCSISGYGQYGPYCLEPGHDLNYLSVAGAMSIPGQLGYPPTRSGLPVADLSSSMFATVSILAAFICQQKTGKGQYIDVAMADSVFSWASTRFGDYMIDGKIGDPEEMHHIIATNDLFETKDNKKIAIGVLEEHFWVGLCRSIRREEWLEDELYKTHELRKKNKKRLSDDLKKIFKTKTQKEWLRILKENNVPVSPVNHVEEAFSDPQLIVREMVQKMFVPYLNKEIYQVSFPAKLSENPAAMKDYPPQRGEHTNEILRHILHYPENKILHLEQSGVIEQVIH